MTGAERTVVVDTNVALDLLLFGDPATAGLRQALSRGELCWQTTPEMREELSRVLDYPHLAQRLSRQGRRSDELMRDYDHWTRATQPAPRACFACKDADDQKFIDLAVAHRALLLSKDAQVLRMARRLSRLGVRVARGWDEARLPGPGPGGA